MWNLWCSKLPFHEHSQNLQRHLSVTSEPLRCCTYLQSEEILGWLPEIWRVLGELQASIFHWSQGLILWALWWLEGICAEEGRDSTEQFWLWTPLASGQDLQRKKLYQQSWEELRSNLFLGYLNLTEPLPMRHPCSCLGLTWFEVLAPVVSGWSWRSGPTHSILRASRIR